MSVIWKQDGAPPHLVRNLTEYLNRKYHLWTGRHGVMNWPAKSPYLSPLFFFSMGCAKTRYIRNWRFQYYWGIMRIDTTKNKGT